MVARRLLLLGSYLLTDMRDKSTPHEHSSGLENEDQRWVVTWEMCSCAVDYRGAGHACEGWFDARAEAACRGCPLGADLCVCVVSSGTSRDGTGVAHDLRKVK